VAGDRNPLRESIGVSVGWLAISMVADGVPALLLPHRLLGDGEIDATELGLVTLVALAIAALVQPAAGWVSDRVGRFPVIAAGTAIAVAGLALLLAPGGALAGTVVALGGVSIAQAGQQALLPDRVGAGWRGRAGGLKSAFDVAGAFAGFLLLAALLGAGEAALAAGALAVALIGGAALTRALVRPGPSPTTPPPRSWEPPAAGRLVRLVAARFLFLLGIYVVGRFLLLFVAERFELGSDAAGGETGMILALLALITVAASLPGGWLADRYGRKPLMLGGGVIGAIGIGLLPMAGSLEAVVAFGAIMAVGSATFGSASWAMLADLTGSRHAGRLMGLANLGTAGAAATAGLFGVFIDGAGFGPAFALAAASSLAGGLLAWTIGDGRLPSPVLIGSTEGAH
jgi:FSR family fosmidomycin resistance protein-like MFS transporter